MCWLFLYIKSESRCSYFQDKIIIERTPKYSLQYNVYPYHQILILQYYFFYGQILMRPSHLSKKNMGL